MRISIPNLPVSLSINPTHLPKLSNIEAIARVSEFLAPGNALVITGAGVSVDSGIRAYRGQDGHYMNPNYKPIFYQELVDPTPKGYSFRQRYWARSYLGYPPVKLAQSNPSHFSLAALQYMGIVDKIITQNVDGLHIKASPSSWSEQQRRDRILELHGTLHGVHCRRGHKIARDLYQERISSLNPAWKEYADDLDRTGSQLRTNPDGDVDIRGVSFDDFVVPKCEDCKAEGRVETILKPDVVFFGESIDAKVKIRSYEEVEKSDRLLLIGTTLATYSAFRLVRHALELFKPVLLLNVGPTRADNLSDLDKIEWKSGSILPGVCETLFGQRKSEDAELRRLMTSGVVKPPIDDRSDHLPVD